jgi:hypothetical protein
VVFEQKGTKDTKSNIAELRFFLPFGFFCSNFHPARSGVIQGTQRFCAIARAAVFRRIPET